VTAERLSTVERLDRRVAFDTASADGTLDRNARSGGRRARLADRLAV